ncbi:hypothetical protein ACET3Z_030509 [Daucus carota]
MASRIRPSLDEIILESTILETLTETPPHYDTTADEITVDLSEDRLIRRNFLLKRSYSFGFERNLGSERLLNEPAMTSPWRYRRSGGFWSTKRPSPFSTLTKHRVFSLRRLRSFWRKLPNVRVKVRLRELAKTKVLREPHVHKIIRKKNSPILILRVSVTKR